MLAIWSRRLALATSSALLGATLLANGTLPLVGTRPARALGGAPAPATAPTLQPTGTAAAGSAAGQITTPSSTPGVSPPSATDAPRHDTPMAQPARIALTVTPFFTSGGSSKAKSPGATTAAPAASPSPPFAECPAVGADTSCAVLIVVGSGGSVQVLVDTSQGPYDGIDDSLIGVLNSSGSGVGHIALSANVPVFAFDGDGLCAFGVSGCPFGPTGYEGPHTAFSNISADFTGGTVTFANGLASGASAYFSLEEAINASTFVSSGPTAAEQGGATPNPSQNSTTCKSGQPVNCATGEFWHQFDDLKIPGRGVPLEFQRTYTAAEAAVAGPLGFGWTHIYNMSLAIETGGNVTVNQENGSIVTFSPTGSGGYVAAPRVLATLVRNSDGTYTFTRNKDKIRYNFSGAGQLVSEVDLNGYSTTLTYTGGQLATIADPAGRTLSFTYTGTNITRISDPIGRTVSFTYDSAGNLASATDVAGGVTSFTYDANHQLLTMTDPRGGKTTNVFDASQRVTSQTDPAERTMTWSYTGTPTTAAGGTTTITDPNGNVTTYQYQNLELLSQTSGSGTPQAATSSYQYDPGTLGVTQGTDPNGHVATKTYDSQGNVLTSVDALGRKTTFAYDALNDVTSTTDSLNVTTTNTYDANGNLLTASRPLTSTNQAATTTNTYGDSVHPGDVTATTNPDVKVTHLSYDQYGNLAKSVDPTGATKTMTYDVIGRMISSVSPDGNVTGLNPANFTTTSTYNAFGQPLTVTDPLARKTTYTYDGNQNRLTITDGNNNTTKYAYNADDEATQVTRADGTTQMTGYDPGGNVIRQTDGLGNTTKYTFDPLNRVQSETDPLNRKTTYTYDGAGNRTSVVDPQGETTSYAYDSANELVSITYSDAKTSNVTFAYDADRQRTSMTDGTGTSTYTYDSLQRLTQSVTGIGTKVGYGYDLKGQLTSLVYPRGNTVTRANDDAGRLTSVSDGLGHTTQFAYDADSNLLTQTYPNGTTATNAYDGVDQLTNISDRQGSNYFLSISYTRDGIGQVSTENDTKDTYDAANRQVGWADAQPAYTYNAADELTKIFGKSLTYDAAGEVLTQGSSKFAYDGRGNRTQQTISGSTTNLTYDQANRLTGYGAAATYGYNGDGLRMSKTQAGQSANQFTYDFADGANGLPLIIEDGSTSYVTGPGGLPLEQIAPDSKTVLYYHHDQLGSTRVLTDAGGNVVQTYRYNPYGNLTASSGSVPNPFQFVGQYLDTESGFYYMRARYYHPVSGQFISKDQLAQGSSSPYAYADDNPTNAKDPSGLVSPGQMWNILGPHMGQISALTGIVAVGFSLFAATGVGAVIGGVFEGLSLATGIAGAVWDCTHSLNWQCALSVAGSVAGVVGVAWKVASLVFEAAADARAAAAASAWAGSGNILLRALRYIGQKALEAIYRVFSGLADAFAKIWAGLANALHDVAAGAAALDHWLLCRNVA